jgi:ankyrin repeat protein
LRKADGASFRTGANSSEVERFRVQLRNELLVKRFELAKSTRFSNLRLAAGADVNAVDPFGYTPLLYAAIDDFGDFEAAMTLLTTR